tara:strand:- start:374 stop:742 length:369 start_codon:yes stop_codon:yes gene_type:complete
MKTLAVDPDPIVTASLSKFGALERSKLADILQAWEKWGLPDDFNDTEVVALFNRDSGSVFLSNEDYDTLVLEDGKLVQWHFLPHDGHEGTLSELLETPTEEWVHWHEDDRNLLRELQKQASK